MFYAIWKLPWRIVQVFAVDPINNKFLINNCGYFEWVDMSEFKPADD